MTAAEQVAAMARELGRPLTPWQQRITDLAMKTDPETGELVYREIGLSWSRVDWR